jgi:tetratricopeptide (TPR) repeat protein
MALTPTDLNTIRKTGISCFFAILVVIGVAWLVQYNRLKKQHLELRLDESGHIVALNSNVVPLDLEAHDQVARRYSETDQPEKALPHLKRCLAFKPDNRLLRYRFASASLDAGLYEQALAALNRLEQSSIEDSLADAISAKKGITLFYLGRFAESKEQLELCLSRFPNSAEAACYLGQIEASRSEGLTRARSYLEQAIRKDSLYVEGWYQLARLTMQQNDYIKARQLLLSALEIDPLHVKSHSRLGMIYYYLHDYVQARKAYLTALALNPRDFNTRYNLGELYYSAVGDTESALHEFKATLAQNHSHLEANFKMGLICLRNNMVKEAIRYFQAAEQQEPKNVRVLLQLAVAYEKLGDKAPALQAYRNIVAADPLNSIALQKIRYLSGEHENNEENQ